MSTYFKILNHLIAFVLLEFAPPLPCCPCDWRHLRCYPKCRTVASWLLLLPPQQGLCWGLTSKNNSFSVSFFDNILLLRLLIINNIKGKKIDDNLPILKVKLLKECSLTYSNWSWSLMANVHRADMWVPPVESYVLLLRPDEAMYVLPIVLIFSSW